MVIDKNKRLKYCSRVFIYIFIRKFRLVKVIFILESDSSSHPVSSDIFLHPSLLFMSSRDLNILESRWHYTCELRTARSLHGIHVKTVHAVVNSEQNERRELLTPAGDRHPTIANPSMHHYCSSRNSTYL